MPRAPEPRHHLTPRHHLRGEARARRWWRATQGRSELGRARQQSREGSVRLHRLLWLHLLRVLLLLLHLLWLLHVLLLVLLLVVVLRLLLLLLLVLLLLHLLLVRRYKGPCLPAWRKQWCRPAWLHCRQSCTG